MAIVHGSPDEVRAALGRGADVEASEFGGLSPLHKAAFRGDMDACRLLLVQAASANLRDSAGQTPLHAAALQLHSEVLQLLLRRGAEADATDNEGVTPARAATARCHHRVSDAGRVAMCLEHLTRAYEAVCQAHRSPAPLPEERPPNAGSAKALACQEWPEPHFGRFALSEAGPETQLLPAGASSGRWSAEHSLKLASATATPGAREEARPLDMQLWELSSRGASDLATCGMHNERLIVMPDLLRAAFRGDLEEVRVMLRHHADIGERDAAGQTALHCAAVAAYPAITSLLVRHGAGVWVTNAEGVTPVRCAVNRLHSVDDISDLRRLALTIDTLLSAQEREMLQLRQLDLTASSTFCPPSSRCGTAPPRARGGALTQGQRVSTS